MSDVHELLEELATDGGARGADSVFEGATVRASRHRRVRRRRRALSALGTAVALVVVVVGVIGRIPDSGQERPHTRVGNEAPTTTTVASASAAQLAAGHWSTIPPSPLSARMSTAEAWTGKELVVWGGYELRAQQTSSDGAAYNPATRTWRMLPPAPLTPRSGAVAVWTGSELVIWGGILPEPAGRVTLGSAQAAAYSPTTNTWRSVGAAPIPPTNAPSGVWTGDRVVLLSGASAASYDPESNRWRKLPPATPAHPPLGWIFAATAGPGRVLAWSQSGGTKPLPSGATEAFSHTDLLRYDESTDRWTSLAAGADAIVQPTWASWTGDQLLVRGTDRAPSSQGPANLESAWYDPQNGTATSLNVERLSPDQIPASALVSAWTGDALWSLDPFASQDGSLRPGRTTAYDPTAKLWRLLKRAPFGCSWGATPVWTGTSVVVYCSGGTPQSSRPAGGLEYIAG